MRRKASSFAMGVATLILLTGCAAAKKVTDNPDKIVDDGKRNTVLMSYKFEVDAADKHPSVTDTNLKFNCAGKQVICFNFDVDYVGRKRVADLEKNRFEKEGVGVFQMEYGEYDLTKVRHSVVVDKWREQNCYNDKKGKRRCYYTTKTNDADYSANLPSDARFFVAPGPGCYIGHMTIHLVENELSHFELDPNMERVNEEMLANLSPAIQGVVAERVTVPCAR